MTGEPTGGAGSSSSINGTERDNLKDRILPEMTLSDGSTSSMTGPPPPFPHYLNSEGRALFRFSVTGNAVLTGGGGTLAGEAARALLEHGLAGLALLDVNEAEAAAQAASLQKDFPDARIVARAIDVTDESGVKTAFEEVGSVLGGIDILCCFAGVVGCTHAIDMTAQEWRRVVEINSTGSFLCAQAAAEQMIAQKRGGSIVLIASISAHHVNFPQPQAAYNVSKAAVLHLAHCLAAEWARHGIRVNSLSPGYMDTVLNAGDGLERARRAWAARNPMGRMGVAQELTGPLVLLCSAAGSFVNGADLIVDGGAMVF